MNFNIDFSKSAEISKKMHEPTDESNVIERAMLVTELSTVFFNELFQLLADGALGAETVAVAAAMRVFTEMLKDTLPDYGRVLSDEIYKTIKGSNSLTSISIKIPKKDD